MSWQIAKSFDFCYGHRVWSQQLNAEFADDLKCACRHLHGHEGRVEVTLGSHAPDGYSAPLTNGMVTDFRHTEWLKRFLNETLDHKFIIDRNDPLVDNILDACTSTGNNLSPVMLGRGDGGLNYRAVGQRLDAAHGSSALILEYTESFFVVDFVPTSENLAKWLLDIVAWKMASICSVVSVDWWETSKSHSLCLA